MSKGGMVTFKAKKYTNLAAWVDGIFLVGKAESVSLVLMSGRGTPGFEFQISLVIAVFEVC